jgi:selenocysteine-specific elongation factor
MTSRPVVVGTAGHIDHGKSAVVRSLTGTDPDRLAEEKARGITIDLGFAHLETGAASLSFVDVPGHERFVRNMLAGAGGIDLVMLVVAADESVMPQTREHFDICRLLQVPAGLVVLTKTDIADADMQELAAMEVRELTAGSFLEHAPLVRVSSRTGAGMETLTAALLELAGRARPRPLDRPPRLPIDRVFTVKGFGTVVTGTLVAGRIHKEDDLIVLPRALAVTARGLHVHGTSRPAGAAGERLAINLGGVEVSDLTRGDTVCARGSLEVTRRLDVAVDVLSGAPLRHGARVRFHQGTTEIIGRVAIAGARDAAGIGGDLPASGSGYARVRLEQRAVLTRGDRFILRAYSPPVTVGGGVVLDPQPPRGAVRTEAALQRFRALDVQQTDGPAMVAAIVGERGAAGLRRAALISRMGLSGSEARAVTERLCSSGTVVCVDGTLLSSAEVARLGELLCVIIRQHHVDHPLADGLPREEARDRAFRRAAPGVFEHVLSVLVAARRIVARERLALVEHQVSLTSVEAAALVSLDGLFRSARLCPPDVASAARDAGVQTEVAARMVQLLVRRHRLMRVEGMLFHLEALEALKEEVRAMKRAGTAGVDVATFKERYGLSRKYAIPLLEYLDRERVTRRSGASRVIL